LLECDVLKVPFDERYSVERTDLSSVCPSLVRGLDRWDERLKVVDEMALAMAATEAGSCSGGELAHRSIGFISLMAGVPLRGMSMPLAYGCEVAEVDRGG
jgi:hypothetical protein